MRKLKNVLIVTLTVLGLGIAADIVCFVLNFIGTTLFVSLLATGLVGMSLGIVLLVKILKKLKKKKLAALSSKSKEVDALPLDGASGNGVLDLYAILGIPVQYNSDGTVKDIFELLGIEPEFDENGVRKLTPYELLGIAPKFSEDGKEVPSVFVIKNRVKRAAKVDLTSRVLTRKLSEQEKEAIAIRETLKKKLDEAQQKGDKNQEEAIKKMLEPPKKPEQKAKEDSKYKPVVYKEGKGNTAVKPVVLNGGVKPQMLMKLTLPLAALFAAAANSPKHEKPEPKPEPKPVEKPQVVPAIPKKEPAVDPKDKSGSQIFGMMISSEKENEEIKSFSVSTDKINIEREH